jgi:DNA-binding transcriptional ArsR family regulator
MTGPWFINVLRVDPNRARLKIVHALDEGVGLETVSSLAARYRAPAATNGGYFGLPERTEASRSDCWFSIAGYLVNLITSGPGLD